ncbi:MAG: ParA family protein [Magnetococcales bacterium]|nr:ParA family protein [Magnetococcales bacterium]MBF0155810.1 ParA family protein [Magnetococcales bacterium]
MKVFAVYNIKGGVGKTTSAVNLAYLSAAGGKSTLLWDLDPQGGASYFLGVKARVKGGAKQLLKEEESLPSAVRLTGFHNLDIVPADLSYRHWDSRIQREEKPHQVLRRLVKPLADQYDHLFLDSPPGLTLLTENIFRLADVLLVPLIPTTLSLRSYNRLVRYLVKHRPGRFRVMPFFNLVNPEKVLHQVVLEALLDRHPIFLKTTIPEAGLIETMGVKRAPLFSFARQSEPAEAYRCLWKEIRRRL